MTQLNLPKRIWIMVMLGLFALGMQAQVILLREGIELQAGGAGEVLVRDAKEVFRQQA